MLCVATATFLSSSKERNTLDFPTMRNGTRKLQDETIDLPYDPLVTCHYKHLHPPRNIYPRMVSKMLLPQIRDTQFTWPWLDTFAAKAWKVDFRSSGFFFEISSSPPVKQPWLEFKMGHSIIALKMECWKTKCKKYQKITFNVSDCSPKLLWMARPAWFQQHSQLHRQMHPAFACAVLKPGVPTLCEFNDSNGTETYLQDWWKDVLDDVKASSYGIVVCKKEICMNSPCSITTLLLCLKYHLQCLFTKVNSQCQVQPPFVWAPSHTADLQVGRWSPCWLKPHMSDPWR